MDTIKQAYLTGERALFLSLIHIQMCIRDRIYGEDITEEEAQGIASYIEDKYDVEVEVNSGNQPVYSFILGVE